MLDACAELLDEVGYDALSTTRIAERAGVAIGSVYQFFPDKRAIIQAVTRRQVERLISRIGRRFLSGDYAGWWDAVDAIIDEAGHLLDLAAPDAVHEVNVLSG